MISVEGALDLHVHSAPDVYPRVLDDQELLVDAAAAGMRGVLLKSHHTLTADRATLAARHAGVGATAFGGLVLNHSVGGLNPVAAETAVAFGARELWMPTLHAAHCLCHGTHVEMVAAEARAGRTGIEPVDAQGALRPETRVILEIVRDADVVLGSGHLGPHETLALFRAARDMGLRRLLVTHPLMTFTRFTHEGLRAAVELGATLELCALSCARDWHDPVSPADTAAAIRAAGARHCILASDGGQTWNARPPEMLARFATSLWEQGVPEEDLRHMLCDGPAELLGLPD